MKQLTKISVAFLGFEFAHHVPAVKTAIEKLKYEGIRCEVKIWSARDGIKKQVESEFNGCKFIDDGLGWLGRFPKCDCRIPDTDEVELSPLEVKHFSYTFSRTTFFRNPQNINKNQIEKFKTLVRKCMCEIKKENISHIFFSKLPHSLIHLAFYYASNRLGLPVVYTENPHFGGDYVYPVLQNESNLFQKPTKHDENFYKFFCDSMFARNLNKNLEPPRYMTADLSYMPSVPESHTPFFRSQIAYKIFKLTKARLLGDYTGRFFELLQAAFSVIKRLYIYNNYVTSSELNYQERYILILLQYHPEQTTSPSALDTPFEEERISLLADKYPNFKIFVREHPSNLKTQSGSFFQYRNLRAVKKMLRAKNVYYLWPSDRLSYKELIENAFFTMSTNSTVAIESILLRTPTVHFSNSFASGFPGVLIAKNVDSITLPLIDKLQDQLDKLTDGELVERSYQTYSKHDLTQGFINGYHELRYSGEQYITGASNIIFSSLMKLAEKTP